MKAKFYPQNETWVIYDDSDNVLVEFPIELVTTELVEYWAKTKNKIMKDIGWEGLDEEERREILDWFEESVFPSKEFGEFLLQDFETNTIQALVDELNEQEQTEEEEEQPSFSELFAESSMHLPKNNEILEEMLNPFLEEMKEENKEKLGFKIASLKKAIMSYPAWEREEIIRKIKEGDSFYINEIKNKANLSMSEFIDLFSRIDWKKEV